MTDDGVITNRMLLDHIQAGKLELLQKLEAVRIDLQNQMNRLDEKVDRGFFSIRIQLDEARQHRQALQEDLDATIRLQGKHSEQLAQLAS